MYRNDALIFLVYRENGNAFGEKKLFLAWNPKITDFLDYRKRFGEAEIVLFHTGKEIPPTNMPKD